jgi:hypothetical protein
MNEINHRSRCKFLDLEQGPKAACICSGHYNPREDIQALCYACRQWFHTGCSKQISGSEAKRKQAEKWNGQAMAGLLQKAVGTMRRGNGYGVTGEYGRVYQAKSILTAWMKGDGMRYNCWIANHGHEAPDPVPEPPEGYYLCPKCGDVI